MMLLLYLLPEQPMCIGYSSILIMTRFHAHSKSPFFPTAMTAMHVPPMHAPVRIAPTPQSVAMKATPAMVKKPVILQRAA